jgi:anti-sigma factor RsiW
MSENQRIRDEILHAFIDGELPEQEREQIEAAVGGDADLSTRAAQFRADKARLADAYGAVAELPLPAKWIEMIEQRPHTARRFIPVQTIAAIAAALLVLVGGPILYRQSTPHEEAIVEEALAARSDALPARQVIAVQAAAQATAASQTIQHALDMPVKAPDLSRMGYTLVGVRTYDRGGSGKAVELLYRSGGNRSFALYVRKPSGPPRFDQYKQGNLRVCIWQDDVIGTVMTGEMSAAEMQRLASLAYTGLESTRGA